MLIADIYDPPTPQGSAEEHIVSNAKDFYDELRRIIFDTKVIISPLKTVKGQGKGTTGAWGLAESLNTAFKIALESCGWQRKNRANREPSSLPNMRFKQGRKRWTTTQQIRRYSGLLLQEL